MSVQSEITRITNAKNASLQAVEDKGVNVTGNESIDNLPDLIRSIPSGIGDVTQEDLQRLIVSEKENITDKTKLYVSPVGEIEFEVPTVQEMNDAIQIVENKIPTDGYINGLISAALSAIDGTEDKF